MLYRAFSSCAADADGRVGRRDTPSSGPQLPRRGSYAGLAAVMALESAYIVSDVLNAGIDDPVSTELSYTVRVYHCLNG